MGRRTTTPFLNGKCLQLRRLSAPAALEFLHDQRSISLEPAGHSGATSPSPPWEFPSGPIHQKAILCLTEMDIDPNAMQLRRAAKVIALADFCPWPVTSPCPRVPSVHPVAWTRSWPNTSSASFRLRARLVTTLFPVSVHFWTGFGPIFIPAQLLRACWLAQGALSRVTARLVTGFVTGFSQKKPGKMRFVTMSRVQGEGIYPPPGRSPLPPACDSLPAPRPHHQRVFATRRVLGWPWRFLTVSNAF